MRSLRGRCLFDHGANVRPLFYRQHLPPLSQAAARRTVAVRAAGDNEVDVDAIVKDIQSKWEAVEDKPSAILYAGGAVVLLWLASTVVGAVNAIPLLPKLLELVGLGYTAWFVYR